MRRLIPILILVSVCIASAQEEAIKTALSANGIANPSISVSGNEVTIAYNQPVSAFGTFDAELAKVAAILKAVSDNMPSATSAVIEQHFDDGQIMVVIGKPADGVAFLSGQMDAQAFLAKLSFEPLTRGPLIIEGVCEPVSGENCQTAPECMCYPNEACQPGAQGANAKGCVVQQIPANAHLVGTEYACNDGYEWNAGLTGCVQKTVPQSGAGTSGGSTSGGAGSTQIGGTQVPGGTAISQEGVMNILTIMGMVVVPLVLLLIIIVIIKKLTRKG